MAGQPQVCTLRDQYLAGKETLPQYLHRASLKEQESGGPITVLIDSNHMSTPRGQGRCDWPFNQSHLVPGVGEVPQQKRGARWANVPDCRTHARHAENYGAGAWPGAGGAPATTCTLGSCLSLPWVCGSSLLMWFHEDY